MASANIVLTLQRKPQQETISSFDTVMNGSEVSGCFRHLAVRQRMSDRGAGGRRDQENHRDRWTKPILKLPALWANECP